MSFNIRYANDADQQNSWKNRKTEVLSFINYYHPEVLGIQEGLPIQMQDLKVGLPDYDFVGVGRDDGKNEGEFAALFYDKQKLIILKNGTFWLSETPEKPSKGWDAALNRICSYALFKDKKTGKQFWAFNTHFDHIGQEARRKSAALILKKITELNSQNLPVVLTGDFNGTETSDPIKIISKNMEDAFTLSEKPHYGPAATWQDFDVNTIPTDRIDFIFVKNFKVLSHRTINDRRENLLYYSDHFPILAEIEFK